MERFPRHRGKSHLHPHVSETAIPFRRRLHLSERSSRRLRDRLLQEEVQARRSRDALHRARHEIPRPQYLLMAAMIPQFPAFKKHELSDKPEVEGFLARYPAYSDFEF